VGILYTRGETNGTQILAPRKEKWDFLQFCIYPLVIEGVEYSTAEHFFQAQKTHDSQEWKGIVSSPTPSVAKRLGGECHLRPDWEEIKCGVMLQVLREKAVQCLEFRQALIDTGDMELIEASPFDSYWGRGLDGKGINKLGEQLMDIRQMIKEGVL